MEMKVPSCLMNCIRTSFCLSSGGQSPAHSDDTGIRQHMAHRSGRGNVCQIKAIVDNHFEKYVQRQKVDPLLIEGVDGLLHSCCNSIGGKVFH